MEFKLLIPILNGSGFLHQRFLWLLQMVEKEFLKIVSKTNAEIDSMIRLAIEDNDFRDLVVDHLIHNPSINTYYHSFLIIDAASKSNPELFYRYWNQFEKLFESDNSYHRNYGLIIIANLIVRDKGRRFEDLFKTYYKQLNDEKITTQKYCITNSRKIIEACPAMAHKIIAQIINSLKTNSYSEKHFHLLASEFFSLLLTNVRPSIDIISLENFIAYVKKTTTSKRIQKEADKVIEMYS